MKTGMASFVKYRKHFAWGMIVASITIGIVTRILPLTHYIDFQGDQSIDAYIFAEMRHGIFPTLVPHYMEVHWPPLYYYLVFPITFLSLHPTLQALPNAVFSLLSIPLLIFAVYCLLDGLPEAVRLFWGAIGGLWWSIMLTDILLATREWCVSPIPFCSLAFVLIAHRQLRYPTYTGKAFASWSMLGLLLALMVSMHAITLYIMPVIFTILSVIFVMRAMERKRALLLVGCAVITAAVCLTPYWLGEIDRHWQNSYIWFAYIRESAQAYVTPAAKLRNAASAYLWLDGGSYFLGDNAFIRKIGLVFLIAIIPVGVATFRGDRMLAGILVCIWLVFLCAASGHPADFPHRRLLIAMSPILIAISSLAFLTHGSLGSRLLGGILAMGIIVSMYSNISMDIRHFMAVFGPSRLVSVSDIADAYAHMPYGASVCYLSGGGYHDSVADRYIDEYVTHRNLRFSDCGSGVYALVPKFTVDLPGSDLSCEEHDSYLAYLRFHDPVPGPPIPASARLIKQTDALSLVLL